MKDPRDDPPDAADDEPETGAETGGATDAKTDDRPAFARDWPKNAALDRLLLAFQRGNYAFVRTEAPRIVGGKADPRVRAAAADLRRRIDPDPLAGILLLVAIALLVTLSGYYLSGSHQHDEAPAPNVKPQPVPPQPVQMQPRSTAQPKSS